MQLPIKTIRGAVEAIRQYLGEIDIDLGMTQADIEDLFSEIDEKLNHIESCTHYLIVPISDETVDLFVTEYHWTCHECSTVRVETYVPENTVYCPTCVVKFRVAEVNHCYKRDAPNMG